MSSMPHFGDLCQSDTGLRPLLILDAQGERCEALPLPATIDAPSIQCRADSLTVVGEDLPAARVFAMRRRAARACETLDVDAVSFSPADRTLQPEPPPVRTAMVFCAGLGTRLRPLTERFPKPAIPFMGAPLVRYTFALLRNAGIEHVVINTHHLPEVMEAVARHEARRLDLTLDVSHERILQDTAGGLREARALIGSEPFLVVNGDAFLSLDLTSLIARHRCSGALASLAVAPPVPGENFRAIEADASGHIVRIRGIGPEREGLRSWHFLGVHVLEPAIFDAIPIEGPRDINGEVYPALIARGAPVEALPVRVGAWADLGTPRRYFEACEDLLTGLCDLTPLGAEAPVELSTCRDAHISGRGSGRSFVDPASRVACGVTLDGAIVGPNVHVGRGAHLRRAVLLPGARIAAGEHLEDALVWPEGRAHIER